MNNTPTPRRNAATGELYGRNTSNTFCTSSVSGPKATKNKIKFSEFNILTFNCRGLASESRKFEWEQEIKKFKWDVIGLCEIRREGEKLIVDEEGNYFYFKGETKGYRGTGFYINKNLTKNLIEIKGINKRISVAKIKIDNQTNLAIIQIYARILRWRREQ